MGCVLVNSRLSLFSIRNRAFLFTLVRKRSLQRYSRVFLDVQFHTTLYNSKRIYVVLMKKLCSSKVCYFLAQGCKNVNGRKNDILGYEMIGEKQAEMKLLEVVTFIYPFLLKARSLNPSVTCL